MPAPVPSPACECSSFSAALHSPVHPTACSLRRELARVLVASLGEQPAQVWWLGKSPLGRRGRSAAAAAAAAKGGVCCPLPAPVGTGFCGTVLKCSGEEGTSKARCRKKAVCASVAWSSAVNASELLPRGAGRWFQSSLWKLQALV